MTHCIHKDCTDPDTCCRRESYKPTSVTEYRAFIRRQRGGLVGFIPGVNAPVVDSFYKNLSYSLQFLEYIYNDVFEDAGRKLHPSVTTHYIKTFYAVSFSIIESVLLANLKRAGITPKLNGKKNDTAEAIIDTCKVQKFITPSLAKRLDKMRIKRNKIHLSKILKEAGVAAFQAHDWNAFNRPELNVARDALFRLIVERSGLPENDPTIVKLFGYMKV